MILAWASPFNVFSTNYLFIAININKKRRNKQKLRVFFIHKNKGALNNNIARRHHLISKELYYTHRHK